MSDADVPKDGAAEPTAEGGVPAKKPVAAKPIPPKPTAAAGAAGATTSATATAPKKPAAKPLAKKKADERRGFFAALIEPINIAWTMFTLTMVAWTLGTLRFMMPNVLAEPPSQFKIGSLDQFKSEPGVNERWKKDFAVWIINLQDDKRLIALSTTCTHLGCTPSWLPTDQKFKCPCHGSGFYMTGINFEGPAPRPLERFAISEVDGVVVVNKAKKFQQELGQWDEPESFINLG